MPIDEALEHETDTEAEDERIDAANDPEVEAVNEDVAADDAPEQASV